VVTFGQYMRPTKKHIAVVEYITPEAGGVIQNKHSTDVEPTNQVSASV